MNQFSKELTNKLNTLNQRMLKKGEVFLLAKAIADSLPLMPADEDNVKLFIITHKRFIDEVTWGLNSYSYIGDEGIAVLEKLICDLTLWRASVAYNPPVTFFRDCPGSVIDDISNLPRYVDITHMCAVGDIINDANYMSDLFRTVVSETKSNMIANGGSSDEAVASPINAG
ncbi:MAG: hypothetical protein HGA25_03555 [Clostridiales bacterium]|nr:hypothetical protein [Clostridiales bacterium]